MHLTYDATTSTNRQPSMACPGAPGYQFKHEVRVGA